MYAGVGEEWAPEDKLDKHFTLWLSKSGFLIVIYYSNFNWSKDLKEECRGGSGLSRAHFAHHPFQ